MQRNQTATVLVSFEWQVDSNIAINKFSKRHITGYNAINQLAVFNFVEQAIYLDI